MYIRHSCTIYIFACKDHSVTESKIFSSILGHRKPTFTAKLNYLICSTALKKLAKSVKAQLNKK